MGMKDPVPTFKALVEKINAKHPDLAYIHTVSANAPMNAPSEDPSVRAVPSSSSLWHTCPLTSLGLSLFAMAYYPGRPGLRVQALVARQGRRRGWVRSRVRAEGRGRERTARRVRSAVPGERESLLPPFSPPFLFFISCYCAAK